MTLMLTDGGSSPTNLSLFLSWYFPPNFYSSSSSVVVLFYASNSPSSSHIWCQHWYVVNEIAPVREEVWRKHIRSMVIGVCWNAKAGFPSPPLDLQLLKENGEQSWIRAFGPIAIIIIIPRSLRVRNLWSIFFCYVYPLHKERDCIVFHFTEMDVDFSYFPTILPEFQSENGRHHIPSCSSPNPNKWILQGNH